MRFTAITLLSLSALATAAPLVQTRDSCACNSDESSLKDYNGNITCVNHSTGSLRSLSCSVKRAGEEPSAVQELAARDCACGPEEVPLQDATGAVACMTAATGALRLLTCSVSSKREEELSARDCACDSDEGALRDYNGKITCMNKTTGAVRGLVCSDE